MEMNDKQRAQKAHSKSRALGGVNPTVLINRYARLLPFSAVFFKSSQQENETFPRNDNIRKIPSFSRRASPSSSRFRFFAFLHLFLFLFLSLFVYTFYFVLLFSLLITLTRKNTFQGDKRKFKFGSKK